MVSSSLSHASGLTFSERLPLQSCKSSQVGTSKDFCPSRLSFRSNAIRKGVSCQANFTSLQTREPVFSDDRNCTLRPGYSPDRWIEDSVVDIVRNIKEAPFLHLLYDSDDNTVRSQRQRVPAGRNWSTEEQWNEVRNCVSSASPDGLILVHQLEDEDVSDGIKVEAAATEESGRTTSAWGILVLGKSVTRTACYILETTSVPSTFGRCTRFCLTKAKCFGPSWPDQMQKSWLLERNDALPK